jgi:DNA invertase Pin-like site-specific DNA recombinase
MTKRAVAYLRVSSEGQVDKFGFAAQEEMVLKYCQKEGIELVIDPFKEEGVSGTIGIEDESTTARVAWIEMQDFMEESGIDLIIIPKLDRLARDLMVQEAIIKSARAKGWTIVSVQEPDLCENDPTRKLIRQVIGAINEWDRAMIVARMKAGRIQKAKSGQHAIGRIPLGYDSVMENGKRTLVVNNDEKAVVEMVFHLRDDKGVSFQKIADYLNENEYQTKAGGSKFYTSTVQKIYKNPKYRGQIELHDNGTVIVSTTNEKLRLID